MNVPHQDGLPSFLCIVLLDKLSVTIHLGNALDFFLCLTGRFPDCWIQFEFFPGNFMIVTTHKGSHNQTLAVA